MTDCRKCATYAELRGPVILAEIRRQTTDEAEVMHRWTRFLGAYHDLHGPTPDHLRRLAGRSAALARVAQELGEA